MIKFYHSNKRLSYKVKEKEVLVYVDAMMVNAIMWVGVMLKILLVGDKLLS